jgi:hypothetical protein
MQKQKKSYQSLVMGLLQFAVALLLFWKGTCCAHVFALFSAMHLLPLRAKVPSQDQIQDGLGPQSLLKQEVDSVSFSLQTDKNRQSPDSPELSLASFSCHNNLPLCTSSS